MGKDQVLWLTLLFRGSKSCFITGQGCDATAQSDEYIAEFERNNLTAYNLPILEFSFSNLDQLRFLVESLEPHSESNINGLIITSPRVVEALELALQQLSDQDRNGLCRRLDGRFVFVVGDKSGRECNMKLGLDFNLESSTTGNAIKLASYIKTFCDNHRPSRAIINLLYPKGCLANDIIEGTLSQNTNVKLYPIVIYETKASNTIESDVVERFRNLDIREDVREVVINHAFFSPSGIDSFKRINSDRYEQIVRECLLDRTVKFRYSAIGRTTEAALIRNRFEVFSVAQEPNPNSLVRSIREKMYRNDGQINKD